METIHSYEPYKIKDAYTDFITRYYDLLCDVEDYFKNASIQGVLDIVDNITCKMLRMETEHDKKDHKLCKDPRVSSDNILTGHQALNKLEALPNFKKFENGEEFAITELFRCLQHAHNAAAETPCHLVFLGHTLSTDQFSFILKHSVYPLIQLHIPPHLCHPRELCFAKVDLTPEEAYEQKAINRVLPHPHNPKLDDVDNKHPNHCLAAAVHYTLHQKLFDKFRELQSNVVDLFCMERKKFFTSVTECMYDAGKKKMKAEKKIKEEKKMQIKKKKLEQKGQPTKGEKQEKKEENPHKEEEQQKKGDAPMDTDDMPLLISDTDSYDSSKGMKKKCTFNK